MKLDPRLKQTLRPMWGGSVSIVNKTYTTTVANQRKQAGTSPVTGMSNIQCQLSPIIESRPTDEQIRTGHVKEMVRRRHVLLNGYFPAIQADAMLCITIEGPYEIRAVESDSQLFLTRLRLEEIKP